MYKLGTHFRNRYSDFLTKNPREVHIRSSDVDRCLESVALVMAGAYPPQDRWIWSKNLSWLPFPIHTVPTKEDGVIIFFIFIRFLKQKPFASDARSFVRMPQSCTRRTKTDTIF